MTIERAFVAPALRLVIEHRRKIAGQRRSQSLFDAAAVEKIIEQGRARLIDDALAPPGPVADDDIEGCATMHAVDLNDEEANMNAGRLLEYADQKTIFIVERGCVVCQEVELQLPHGRIERTHNLRVLAPALPAW